MLNNYKKVSQNEFKELIKAYFLWKELNSIVKSNSTRAINFPESISEALCCKAMNFRLNKISGGDAINSKKKIIEIKASSNWDRDTSSFSPSTQFDCLYFLRLDKINDELYIYDMNINSFELDKIQITKTQTVFDQKNEKRRPRFSIIKQLIIPNNIKPIKKIELRTNKIITL